MIAGNLCRCTGYQNIVKSVLRAAEIARERPMTTQAVRRQGPAGRGPAVAARPGPVRRRRAGRPRVPCTPRCSARRTPTPGSSTSTSTDVLDVEGVHLVWTHDDLTGPMAEPLPLLIPHPALTHGRTQYALAKDEVNYVGEAIAFVVADDRYVAEDAVGPDPGRPTSSSQPVVGIDAARAARASCTTTCPATSAPGWSRRTATPGPPSRPRRTR